MGRKPESLSQRGETIVTYTLTFIGGFAAGVVAYHFAINPVKALISDVLAEIAKVKNALKIL